MTVAKGKLRPSTRVVKGWVVKKMFTKMERDDEKKVIVPKQFLKTISKLFSNREAAVTFCNLTTKYPPPAVAGEENVQFHVYESEGYDDLKSDQNIT